MADGATLTRPRACRDDEATGRRRTLFLTAATARPVGSVATDHDCAFTAARRRRSAVHAAGGALTHGHTAAAAARHRRPA
eukprot:scaffold74663_cov63-Phaeocystis_antarctica.AAC.2